MKRLLLVLLSVLFLADCFAQTRKIDSLKHLYAHARSEKARLNYLLAICDESETLPKDTLFNYALKAKKLSLKLNDGIAHSYAALAEANAYIRWDNPDSAEAIIKPELAKYKPADPKTRAIYFKLSGAKVDLMRNSSYKEVLTVVYRLLHEAEAYKDSLAAAEQMNTIGALDYDMDVLSQSRQWLYKALNYTSDSPEFYRIRAVTYFNLGDNYSWIGKQDSATWCINRAEELSRKIQNLYLLSAVEQKRCVVYIKYGQYDKAEQAILKSIEMIKPVEGTEPQQDKLILLASVYEGQKLYGKAINVLRDGIIQDSIYKRNNLHAGKKNDDADLQRIDNYQELARCYRLNGDYKNYSSTLERVIAEKDSFYKTSSASAIAELQTKYDVDKKESTIARQKLQLDKENYLFYGSVIVLILIAVILILIFTEYRRRQRVIAAKAVNDAEEGERRRIAADLHDNLGAQLSFIKRNVEFLKDHPEGFKPSDEQRYLDNLNDVAKTAMIDLRETLWVLNKDEVYIQEFADKLKFYLRQQLVGRDNIECDLKEQVAVNWQLSSGEVMHLFRIVQELVNNIIKHSGATKVAVEFSSLREGNYQLIVRDNGTGFNIIESESGHYGLTNVRQRAAEIKAVLEIESDGNGTRIRLEKIS